MTPDLKLILNEDDGTQIEIMVFHQVMINASPVFEAMLGPRKFAEGERLNQDKFLELPLPDDDPHAMRLLCDIFHMQNQKVKSAAITPDLLDSIATLVDKYDLARAIHPWPLIWLNLPDIRKCIERQDKPQDLISDQDLLRWIHISCHLGYSVTFGKMTSYLSARLTLEHLNQPSFADSFAKLPARLQDQMRANREKSVNAFRHACMGLVNELEHSPTCSKTEDDYEDEDGLVFHCNSILLGNAIVALRESFGPDWRSAEAWNGSVTEIHKKMKTFASSLCGPTKLRARKVDEPYLAYRYDHRACGNTKFSYDVANLFRDATEDFRAKFKDFGNPFYQNRGK
ncbi:hypothetical protein B0A52_08339 [Exophiala mesophila]|uniref:BTB domain-containing protein n=1 Tax=Exophiala mesophila TaxID=212818 RepID=A0A438MVH2_EXOME|nr:hypothetical protein B0A52_08339 [Exophiala mesophila]